jgi:tetratricopeptide (TPR) repeat protein
MSMKHGLLAALAMAACCWAGGADAFPGAKHCYVQPGLKRNPDAVIRDLTQSMADMSRPTEDKACELFARGLLYHFEGKPQQAAADYAKAAGLMHDFSAAHEMLGDAETDMGEADKAAADYAEAAKSVEDPAQLADRCWTRAVRGHPLDRALSDCNAALARRPQDSTALDSRCFVHFRLGDYAGAIADCDAALKLAPKGTASFYVRGMAKVKSGDAAGGEADMAAAKAVVPNVGDYYALWGVKL